MATFFPTEYAERKWFDEEEIKKFAFSSNNVIISDSISILKTYFVYK